ncbi:hypothetical protein E1B28_012523 [Marasmius oreades]|uniref:Sas10 C-terminal domain-containing protein n=1 Tax=Marasmius oreades TaxID=181124 RepID=A0A9P7RRN5_9AGAR|nr:uncharacterized protein E1B28_012523 [Marasmius oreades]KAG7088541.1 hypothetical protein E1B28_012523 [Marasmius oreades]
MPRRPSKKIRNLKQKLHSVNRNDARISKWNDISDIPLDEEEEFHASRDQILLDGENNEDENVDEDEVFTLKGMPDHDDDGDSEDEAGIGDEDMDVDLPTPRKSSGRKKQKTKASEESEEEEEEEEEIWGKGKAAYYASNDAQIESDDEETIALELQEAKRLQIKSRENMTDTDFGLEDVLDLENTEEENFLGESVSCSVKSLPQDKNSIIRHLEKTDPLSLALARDWSDTANSLQTAKARLERLQATDPHSLTLGMVQLHYQTLLTYGSALAFYLHLRAQEKYAHKPELLNEHPVMKRLMMLKQSLMTLEELDFAGEGSDEDDESDFDLGVNDEELMADALQLWESEDTNNKNKTKTTTAVTKDVEVSVPPKKKRKTLPDSAPVFDLVEPKFVPSSKTSSSRPSSEVFDVYGEATSLQSADAADKSARKKSLRFHTSKIDNTSARRRGARNMALGGDDDIPYRERKREKEDRVAQGVKARVQNQGGMDLDNTEPEHRVQEDVEGEDGYYELVSKKLKEKKVAKKAEYEAARAERLVDVKEGVSGPRSLTRAILSNKGLTPHRAKNVRNPRVKKRQKFEQAKRKVASQKAVYKGGISKTGGRYDGERTGISKVVKSVHLG